MADDNIRKSRKSSTQATTGDAAITSASPSSKVQTPPTKKTKEKTDNNELQKIGDKIIAKMVNEGQLVRNTGTNSLKSIGDKLVKFDSIFKSINTEMQVQTSVLRNIHNELMNEHDRLVSVDKRRIEQSKIKESEEAEEHKKSDKPPKGSGKEKSSSSQGVMGLVDKFLGGPIGMLMTIPLRAIGAVMGGITGDIVSDYIIETAENLGIHKQYLDAIAEPLKGGLIWGGIGMAISKRMGVFGLVAGAAWPLADQLLDAAGFDPKQTLMGLEIGDVFAAIMTGSFMYLLRSNFNPMSIMRMIEEVGTSSGKSALPKSTIAKIGSIIGRSKFALVAAINLGFEAVEGSVVSYLENNAGIDAEDSQSVINWTQMGMSIGAMFGPYGLIAGAAIGLTVGLGNVIYNWLNSKERITKQRLQRATKIFDKVNTNPNIELDELEIADVQDSIEFFKENNNLEVADRLTEILKKQSQIKGQEYSDRTDKLSFSEEISENQDILQQKLLDITKLPTSDQAAAYDTLVNDLHEKNPELAPKYISDVLKHTFGNNGLGLGKFFGTDQGLKTASIVSMFENITPNSQIIQSVNYDKNGNHVSSIFEDVVMKAFLQTAKLTDDNGNIIPTQREHFDPSNPAIQEWIKSNPDIRNAMNIIYAASLEAKGHTAYDNKNGVMEPRDIFVYKAGAYQDIVDNYKTGVEMEGAIDFVNGQQVSQTTVGPQTVIIQGGDTTNIHSNTVAGSNNNTQSHNFNLRGGNGRGYGTGGISRPN